MTTTRRTIPAREPGEQALHNACGLPWDEHVGGACPDQPRRFELPERCPSGLPEWGTR